MQRESAYESSRAIAGGGRDLPPALSAQEGSGLLLHVAGLVVAYLELDGDAVLAAAARLQDQNIGRTDK